MKARTRARAVALQALYEIDLTGHLPEEVIQQRAEGESLDERMIAFAREIVIGVLSFVPQLDQYIAAHAPEWPLDQVAIVDRNILRIALWEIAISESTPIKVAINEAVELAKIFGSDSAPRFVNGVLGSLAARQNEIKQAFRQIIKT